MSRLDIATKDCASENVVYPMLVSTKEKRKPAKAQRNDIRSCEISHAAMISRRLV